MVFIGFSTTATETKESPTYVGGERGGDRGEAMPRKKLLKQSGVDILNIFFQTFVKDTTPYDSHSWEFLFFLILLFSLLKPNFLMKNIGTTEPPPAASRFRWEVTNPQELQKTIQTGMERRHVRGKTLVGFSVFFWGFYRCFFRFFWFYFFFGLPLVLAFFFGGWASGGFSELEFLNGKMVYSKSHKTGCLPIWVGESIFLNKRPDRVFCLFVAVFVLEVVEEIHDSVCFWCLLVGNGWIQTNTFSVKRCV